MQKRNSLQQCMGNTAYD